MEHLRPNIRRIPIDARQLAGEDLEESFGRRLRLSIRQLRSHLDQQPGHVAPRLVHRTRQPAVQPPIVPNVDLPGEAKRQAEMFAVVDQQVDESRQFRLRIVPERSLAEVPGSTQPAFLRQWEERKGELRVEVVVKGGRAEMARVSQCPERDPVKAMGAKEWRSSREELPPSLCETGLLVVD
jgi:hypothetical protein